MAWQRGREEIVGMLERGELSQVVADIKLAKHLVTSARRHLNSADAVCEEDPELAYAALYDAIRKAMTALLQAQGLRPTTSGGHLAVQHAVIAQFGASMGTLLRPVDRIRTTRHTVEYLDDETWIDAEAVRADLPAAHALVDAAEKAIEHLTCLRSLTRSLPEVRAPGRHEALLALRVGRGEGWVSGGRRGAGRVWGSGAVR